MRQKMLRCLVPLFGLALLALFAVLYAVEPKVYYRALDTIGISPFKYPFLDWEYIGANIKCWGEGINVYITNPCDVTYRTYDLSPLLLRAVFIPTGRTWTMPIGLGLVCRVPFVAVLARQTDQLARANRLRRGLYVNDGCLRP